MAENITVRPGFSGTSSGPKTTRERSKEAEELDLVWNAFTGQYEPRRQRGPEVGRQLSEEELRDDDASILSDLQRKAEGRQDLVEHERANRPQQEQPAMLMGEEFLNEQERLRAQQESNRVTTGDEFRSGARPLEPDRSPVGSLDDPSLLSQQPAELMAGEGETEQSPEVRMERLAALKERAETDIMSLTDEEIDELVALQREMESRRGSR